MIKSWFPVLTNLFTVSSTLYEYERYKIDCFPAVRQSRTCFCREFQHFILYNFDSCFQNSLLWIIFGYWINILNTFWVNYYTVVVSWKTLNQFTVVIWTVKIPWIIGKQTIYTVNSPNNDSKLFQCHFINK